MIYVLNVKNIIYVVCITRILSRKNELTISQLSINVYVLNISLLSLFFKHQTVYNNDLKFIL